MNLGGGGGGGNAGLLSGYVFVGGFWRGLRKGGWYLITRPIWIIWSIQAPCSHTYSIFLAGLALILYNSFSLTGNKKAPEDFWGFWLCSLVWCDTIVQWATASVWWDSWRQEVHEQCQACSRDLWQLIHCLCCFFSKHVHNCPYLYTVFLPLLLMVNYRRDVPYTNTLFVYGQ